MTVSGCGLWTQEPNGGAHFHTPGGGTLLPMSSDPLSLLSLHPSQRKNKLKLTLRYLGNPERGAVPCTQACPQHVAAPRAPQRVNASVRQPRDLLAAQARVATKEVRL